VALAVLLAGGIGTALTDKGDVGLDAANQEFGGNVEGIANLIFSDFLFAFQATAALLITAGLGAVILTHREAWKPKVTQKELSVARFMVGAGHPGNKPNPGVYARHNAVNTPAILPDGSLSLDSVPEPVRSRDDSLIIDHRVVSTVVELVEGEDQN
jgi:NADH-quinone oxidoreductase subunit J